MTRGLMCENRRFYRNLWIRYVVQETKNNIITVYAHSTVILMSVS